MRIALVPLNLFPEDSLAASVTTSVLVGVWVVTFFNLRLGWTASGFVVPGYLAPVLLLRPLSAVAIVVEAVLTYLIVYTLSESFAGRKPWSSFFGRDRFFALVLTSILVRVLMDGWLLPAIALQMAEHFQVELSVRNSLHSYGLIIVSLLANCLWKPGIVRGLTTNAVTVGLTFLIIRFGLMEFTNFGVANLQFMYEDIAASLLASPKAYIVLVTAAFIASWMNLYYGWDFNGIMIPALLALQWYEPLKIGTSLLEAIIVLGLASALLKLPWLRSTTMEGSRKVLLFFNVAFAYRMALSYAAPVLFPELKPTDVFGFGYLLSTLLAMKAHQKNLLVRLIKSTIQVSAVGALGGTAVGFVLMLLPVDSLLAPTSTRSIAETEASSISAENLREFVHQQRLAINRLVIADRYHSPDTSELRTFEVGMTTLKHFLRSNDSVSLTMAENQLGKIGFRLTQLPTGEWVVFEPCNCRGWGFYVFHPNQIPGHSDQSTSLNFDTAAKKADVAELIIQVPCPVEETDTLAAGVALFRKCHARALCVSTAPQHHPSMTRRAILQAERSLQRSFQTIFNPEGFIQVRQSEQPGTTCYVQKGIPNALGTPAVQVCLEDARFEWTSAGTANVFRRRSWCPFVELRLSKAAISRLTFSPMNSAQPGSVLAADQQSSINSILKRQTELIARRETQAYRPASLEELLAFDQHVLTPAWHVVRNSVSKSTIDASDLASLSLASQYAGDFGYRLVLETPKPDDAQSITRLMLFEDDSTINAEHTPATNAARKNWGTLVLSANDNALMFLEVPRPLAEEQTVEFGLQMFREVRPAALFIAGAHPDANADGTADLLTVKNKHSLMNLCQQVIQRESRGQPLAVLQIRAIGQPIDADVLMATGNAAFQPEEIEPLTQNVLRQLQAMNLSTKLVDGTVQTAGYEFSGTFLASTMPRRVGHEFAVLWLSSETRKSLKTITNLSGEIASLSALGVRMAPQTLEEVIQQRPHMVPAVLSTTQAGRDTKIDARQHSWSASQQQSIVDRLIRWQQFSDVHELYSVWTETNDGARPASRWLATTDEQSGRGFLAIFYEHNWLIMKLGQPIASGPDDVSVWRCETLTPKTLSSFQNSSALFMAQEITE